MLPTEYQNYIAISRYARWIEKENRREHGVKLLNDMLVICKDVMKN